MKGCLAFLGQDRAYTKALCSVSRCNKMVAASKRFTVHRAPKVLTVCLKRFEDFTGGKISKVRTQPEGDLFLPGAGYFPKRCTLSQAVEFFCVPFWKEGLPREDKDVLCSTLAENSFLPPKPLPLGCFREKTSVCEPQRCIYTPLAPGLGRLFRVVFQDHF